MNFTEEYGEPTSGWIAAHTNIERADWAEAAVEAFRAACSGDMDETAIYDLVCNLGHLCDRLSAEHEDFDLTFDDMVDRARSHYEGERGEGDSIEGAARFEAARNITQAADAVRRTIITVRCVRSETLTYEFEGELTEDEARERLDEGDDEPAFSKIHAEDIDVVAFAVTEQCKFCRQQAPPHRRHLGDAVCEACWDDRLEATA